MCSKTVQDFVLSLPNFLARALLHLCNIKVNLNAKVVKATFDIARKAFKSGEMQ